MTRIAWIASYPKAGNTWLRSMLMTYIGGAPAETLRELGNGAAIPVHR
jgi:hypothetical protein